MDSSKFLFRTDPGAMPITTWEGLKKYLLDRPACPEMPDAEEYRGMAAPQREAFNLARRDFIGKGIRARTSASEKALHMYRRIRIANVDAYGNTGLILDGDSWMGKTKLCRRLMEETFDRYIQVRPDYERDGYIPIAYVEADPRSSGRALVSALLEFYGETVADRYKTRELAHKLVKCMNRAQTELVIIDEFQNVHAKNVGNGETVDYLKALTNAVGATWVISGIDVLQSAVLEGVRGNQLRSRFAHHRLSSFGYATDEEKLEWNRIVKTFENELPLFGQPRGSILQMAPILHEKSRGSIGTMSRVLRGAAIEAILYAASPEEETITSELVDGWYVDVAAQEKKAPRRASKPARSMAFA